MRIRAKNYATAELIDVRVDAEWIADVRSAGKEATDLEAGWVAPALFDLQINGSDGHSFNSPELTVDQIRHVVAVCHRHGIVGLCPTLITNSAEALVHGFATVRRACETDMEVARAVSCLHLEGPYISPDDGPRGAHPRQFVRPPDWDEFRRFQEASDNRIRLVTLAPEIDGAIGFIERLVASGVIVSIGHTNAKRDHLRSAIAAGARLSTHLGNGAHAMLPRHENYIWEQLAADELWASIICDGHHLTPAVMRCILRVKTSRRTILTCDASSLAGLPPGRYHEWGQDIEVQPGNRVVVAGTPYLAGSGVFTDHCVATVLKQTDASLAHAIDMASARPRELLGLEPRTLQPGAPADLILFDWQPGSEFRLRATVIAGRQPELQTSGA
jgi:N-acetylglucosamine-6-phosphate deacetylase